VVDAVNVGVIVWTGVKEFAFGSSCGTKESAPALSVAEFWTGYLLKCWVRNGRKWRNNVKLIRCLNKNSAVGFDTWLDYLRLSGGRVLFGELLVVFSKGKKLVLGCLVTITHMIFSN